MPICSVKGCAREAYEGGKCLFHCDKESWYDKDKYDNKNWKKSEEKCKKFWEKFREELRRNEDSDEIKRHSFAGINFPAGNFSSADFKEFNKPFDFHNCWFLGLFSFSGNIFNGSVTFYDSSFYDGVSFGECSFLSKRGQAKVSLIFSNTKFLRKLLIHDVKCEFLAFKMVEIQADSSIFFSSHNKTECFVALDGKSIGNAVLRINTSLKPFLSDDCLESDLKIRFESVVFAKEQRLCCESVDFVSCVFEKTVYIEGKDDLQERIVMGRIAFFNPTFAEKAKVFLNDLAVKTLELKNFVNNAEIFRFTDVKVVEEISFSSSNLSSVEFSNFDISYPKAITLKNVFFIGATGNAILNNVKWGEDLVSRLIDPTRDTLRQLKHSNDLQGNYIEGNKFYALEMDKYRREKKPLLQKIIFFVGRYSSNFSQNWLLPIFWFFVFGFLLFLWNEKVVVLADFGLNFLSFINPFNTSGVSCEGGTTEVTLPFVLFKLISVFLGYQLVTSLRHYTKRR